MSYIVLPQTATEIDRIIVGRSMARNGYGVEDVQYVTRLPHEKCRQIVGLGGQNGRTDNRRPAGGPDISDAAGHGDSRRAEDGA